jgi:archaemetzincin
MMTLARVLMIFCVSASLWGCTSNNKGQTRDVKVTASGPKKQKLPTIEVYTVGKVNNGLRNALLDSLRTIYKDCRFVKNVPLPQSAYYKPRNRYLAVKLNSFLSKWHTKNNIVVGLTQVDISLMNFRNRPNSGIFGSSNYIGGGVCVFSSYRKSLKEGLFCVMKHELAHAFGLRHCTVSNCVMHDAGGTDLRGTQFCKNCKVYLKSKGWKL